MIRIWSSKVRGPAITTNKYLMQVYEVLASQSTSFIILQGDLCSSWNMPGNFSVCKNLNFLHQLCSNFINRHFEVFASAHSFPTKDRGIFIMHPVVFCQVSLVYGYYCFK